MAWWVTFETGEPGCVEVKFDPPRWGKDCIPEVSRVAAEATGRAVKDVQSLPYPANPRLVKAEHPEYGACPSFCFQPRICAGHTSCPRSYACDN